MPLDQFSISTCQTKIYVKEVKICHTNLENVLTLAQIYLNKNMQFQMLF